MAVATAAMRYFRPIPRLVIKTVKMPARIPMTMPMTATAAATRNTSADPPRMRPIKAPRTAPESAPAIAPTSKPIARTRTPLASQTPIAWRRWEIVREMWSWVCKSAMVAALI